MQRLLYYLLNEFSSSEVESDIIEYLKKKDKIVFDVGCFRGTFTENLIKNEQKLGLESNFFLFDPNPNVKNYIKHLLQNEKVKYFNLAFDNSNTNKKFYLNTFMEPAGSSLNPLLKDDKKWTISRKFIMQILQPFKRIGGFSEINVQTQTLDNFCLGEKIENIDVLKIDTEGNDLNVLNGAKKLLSENKIKIIYTEISSTKINFKEKEKNTIDFLNSYNFDLRKIYKNKTFSTLSGLRVTDNLFVNRNLIH
jgi:FkbM family methyltransferase